MKKHLLIFVLLISILSFINTSKASADCSLENPCGTWAVLDSQGVVTNVISCQTSVCGSGNFAGQTVVPQVAPNSVTHDTYAIGSYIGNADQGTQVTYSNGTFTITENTTVTKSFTEIEGNTFTTSEVNIPVTSRSFTYEDTIGKTWGQVEMMPITFNENSSTILNVTQTNLVNTIRETTSFNERKTVNEIEQSFVTNNLNLLLSKIQTLVSLLGTWVK